MALEPVNGDILELEKLRVQVAKKYRFFRTKTTVKKEEPQRNRFEHLVVQSVKTYGIS